jgi:CO dehydrogenase maturation factor
VAHVDGLVVVSEPSMRSLMTGAEVGRMASELGLKNQVLAVNRHAGGQVPDLPGLPQRSVRIPPLPGLMERQMTDASVLSLPEADAADAAAERILALLMEQDGVKDEVSGRKAAP